MKARRGKLCVGKHNSQKSAYVNSPAWRASSLQKQAMQRDKWAIAQIYKQPEKSRINNW